MKLKQYLTEQKNDIEKAKKELKSLKKGKLTALGMKRVKQLEDLLARNGIFNY